MGPRVGGAAGAEGDEEHDDGGGEDRGADVVDLFELGEELDVAGVGAAADVEVEPDDGEGDSTDGNVNEEAPAPAMLCEDTTKQRTESCSDGKGDMLDSQVRSSFAKRDDIAEYHLREEIDTTSSQPLNDPAKDQDGARVSRAADCASDSKDKDSKHHGVLASQYITQLAIQWLEDSTRQEKCGSDPRKHGTEVERIRNGGQRGVGDTSLECREKERYADGDEGSPKACTALPL